MISMVLAIKKFANHDHESELGNNESEPENQEVKNQEVENKNKEVDNCIRELNGVLEKAKKLEETKDDMHGHLGMIIDSSMPRNVVFSTLDYLVDMIVKATLDLVELFH